MARGDALTHARQLVRRLATTTATVLLSSLLLGCAGGALARSPYEIIAKEPTVEVASSVPDVSPYEWTIARDRLARLRQGQPQRPYVERLRITISDPRTGKRYEARGAVAISPGRAARLLLVGPGGTTALDVWVSRDRFRFAVPAINLEKRGGTDPEEARGLPIGMLRWWFLSPLAGRILLARSSPGESAWILRDGRATITLRSDGRRFVALRREGELLEGIEWLSQGLAQGSGARGRYVESRFGLKVDVVVEERLPTEPDPAAFVDPDEKGTPL